jgi:flagellar protein FliO/FliZ
VRSRPAWRTRPIVAAIVCLCVPAPAFADTFHRDRTPLPAAIRDGAQTATKQASSGSGGSFVRMIVGLAVVLAVVYGIYWLLRHWNRAKHKGASTDGRLTVVATTPLGQNRAVHLVRVGEELILVGSSEHSVTPIRVYGPDEAARIDGDDLYPSTVVPAPPMTVSELELARAKGDQRWKGNSWSSVTEEIRKRTTRG